MKYYHYISETKVNMLYPQIPSKIIDRFEAKVGLSISGLNTEMGFRPKDLNLIKKTQIIEEYILSNQSGYNVGSPDLNHKYFYGKDKFFLGVRNNILYLKSSKIFLIGSANHIIGANYKPPSISGSVVYALEELMRDKLESEEEITDLPEAHWLLNRESLVFTLKQWEELVPRTYGLRQIPLEVEFEYLAKRLYYFSGDKPFALATPIYIAEY